MSDTNENTDHTAKAIKKARKGAFMTIDCTLEKYEDCRRALSDIDIDKVRDSVQVLMICKQIESLH